MLLKRAAELQTEIEKLETRRTTLNKALAISGPAAVSLSLDDPKQFNDSAGLRRMAGDERDGLDLSGVAKLEAEAKDTQDKLRIISDDIVRLSETKGGLLTVIANLDEAITWHRAALAELDPKAEAATKGHQVLMVQAFIDKTEWPKRLAAEIKERRPITSYERRSGERSTNAANSVAETNAKLAAYNRNALDFQQLQIQVFAYDQRLSADTVLTWMQDIWRQIREQIRSQRDTGLPERRLQCEMAERSFTSSFTTDFCATILSNVEGRDDTIIALNANLDRINFGGDTYKLISSLKPEFDDYLALFRKIRASTETRKADLDLFNMGELSPAERDTLFRIRGLLLDREIRNRRFPSCEGSRITATTGSMISNGREAIILSRSPGGEPVRAGNPKRPSMSFGSRSWRRLSRFFPNKRRLTSARYSWTKCSPPWMRPAPGVSYAS